jgi:hypothetical protein
MDYKLWINDNIIKVIENRIKHKNGKDIKN